MWELLGNVLLRSTRTAVVVERAFFRIAARLAGRVRAPDNAATDRDTPLPRSRR